MLRITNIILDSFQEYEGHQSLVLFTAGCNFFCLGCYNLEQVFSDNDLGNPKEVIEKNISPIHDAVVFLGGEPTIWDEDLIEVIKFVKSKNLLVKVFSNGFKSEVIKKINEQHLVDAYSIDFKSLEHVKNTIGVEIKDNIYIKNLKLSLDDILKHNVDLEIRTTLWENVIEKDKLIDYVKKNYPAVRHILQQDFLKRRSK
jgi:pyruvate formate lyase activating enzyme